ncbi:MAG: NAD-dependent deacetylase [Actinomycetia bacterium]|nr:NAD-dependent deacetylase [Actinomycetes bacterium]
MQTITAQQRWLSGFSGPAIGVQILAASHGRQAALDGSSALAGDRDRSQCQLSLRVGPRILPGTHFVEHRGATSVACVTNTSGQGADNDDQSVSLVSGQSATLQEAVSAAAELIEVARKIVVLTGAGISTDSRIPDFRGPQGVWTKNPGAEKQATLQNYMVDQEMRRRSWRNRLDSPMWAAEPNPGHYALTGLERRRKLHLLVTQNVDGLHHDAGSNPERIVEIHGTAKHVGCMSCSYRAPMQEVLNRVRLGEDDPACPLCSGILKSATISFGQSLITEDLERAQEAAETCDLVLAVGSTLAVYPIAAVVPVAKRSGAGVVIVNGSPTEMDELGDVVVNGSISEVLPQLC